MSDPRPLGPNEHKCPRPGCATVIPITRFACGKDWQVLPARIRQDIKSNRHMNRARVRAIQAAFEVWRAGS